MRPMRPMHSWHAPFCFETNLQVMLPYYLSLLLLQPGSRRRQLGTARNVHNMHTIHRGHDGHVPMTLMFRTKWSRSAQNALKCLPQEVMERMAKAVEADSIETITVSVQTQRRVVLGVVALRPYCLS